MSEPASISTGIADRYATAVFELAKEGNRLDQVEGDLDQLDLALKESEDFAALIRSPIYSRDDMQRGIAAVAENIGLSNVVTNTLRLMATKRRLFVLPQLIRTLRDRIAEHKGEVTADVVSARELSDAQADRLAETLRAKAGKDVKISTTVDEALIGGLVVKMGSKMIDTSIRSKLATLQNAMKEVG